MDSKDQPSYKQSYEELEPLSTNPSDEFKLYLVREKATSSYKMAKKTCIYECSDKSQDETLHEVKMLRQLKNPHIIKYYDVYLEEDQFIVILEFCEEGDLDYYIKKRQERKEMLSEKLILSWVMQILMALEYVHSRNIIHRLVCSHNIYMNHQGDMKLGSFGAARMLENTLEKAMTVVGSPCNLSPEIVQGKPYDSKADIWALGCLIYQLAAFEHPYQIKNLPQLYEMIVKLPPADLPIKYSKYLNPIYKKMMKKNPNFRPSASELLQQDVFVKLMREYTKKKKIDSLDLREITPKQLLIHRKKNPKSFLPPLNSHKSPGLQSTKSSLKKQKTPVTLSLSRSREKLIKKNSQNPHSPPLDKDASTKQQKTKESPVLSRKTQTTQASEKAPEEKKEPQSARQTKQQQSNIITSPNLEQGEYISLLCQLKLELLAHKYSPNMEQIFEQTIEFDELLNE